MDFNGRVNIMEKSTNNAFTLQDRIPVKQTAGYRDALQGNLIDSPLSLAYFSAQNIQILQNGIRAGVYKLSNGQYKIGEQSGDELKMIMRSIFLSYSANMPHSVSQQIKALNDLVLDYCVNKVYGEAQAYKKYLYDASTLVVPIEHPTYIQNDKTLNFKGWF
jgi:hypothetical protein